MLETQGIRVRKHERIVGSAVQVMTNLSGWLHQVITQGLWAPLAHFPNSPNSPNQPSLHNHRSLEHFGHISGTFPTISFLLFYWTTQGYLTISLSVIIHLRISSRDIIISHIPTGYEPRLQGQHQSIFKFVRIIKGQWLLPRYQASSD